jgi:hypothetical protein
MQPFTEEYVEHGSASVKSLKAFLMLQSFKQVAVKVYGQLRAISIERFSMLRLD